MAILNKEALAQKDLEVVRSNKLAFMNFPGSRLKNKHYVASIPVKSLAAIEADLLATAEKIKEIGYKAAVESHPFIAPTTVPRLRESGDKWKELNVSPLYHLTVGDDHIIPVGKGEQDTSYKVLPGVKDAKILKMMPISNPTTKDRSAWKRNQRRFKWLDRGVKPFINGGVKGPKLGFRETLLRLAKSGPDGWLTAKKYAKAWGKIQPLPTPVKFDTWRQVLIPDRLHTWDNFVNHGTFEAYPEHQPPMRITVKRERVKTLPYNERVRILLNREKKEKLASVSHKCPRSVNFGMKPKGDEEINKKKGYNPEDEKPEPTSSPTARVPKRTHAIPKIGTFDDDWFDNRPAVKLQRVNPDAWVDIPARVRREFMGPLTKSQYAAKQGKKAQLKKSVVKPLGPIPKEVSSELTAPVLREFIGPLTKSQHIAEQRKRGQIKCYAIKPLAQSKKRDSTCFDHSLKRGDDDIVASPEEKPKKKRQTIEQFRRLREESLKEAMHQLTQELRPTPLADLEIKPSQRFPLVASSHASPKEECENEPIPQLSDRFAILNEDQEDNSDPQEPTKGKFFKQGTGKKRKDEAEERRSNSQWYSEMATLKKQAEAEEKIKAEREKENEIEDPGFKKFFADFSSADYYKNLETRLEDLRKNNPSNIKEIEQIVSMLSKETIWDEDDEGDLQSELTPEDDANLNADILSAIRDQFIK
jgi:hypothetical protein